MKYLSKKYKLRRKSNKKNRVRKSRVRKSRVRKSRVRKSRARRKRRRRSKKYGGLRGMDLLNSTLYSSKTQDMFEGNLSTEGSTIFQYINRGQ